MFLQWRARFELLECKNQGNACFYRSRRVRVLAWMMPRSHRVGFLPDSACLCPNTSMATAPSVKYSIKSSLTDTASSCRIRNKSWANYIFSFIWLLMLLYTTIMYLTWFSISLHFTSPCSYQTPPYSVGPWCWWMRMACRLQGQQWWVPAGPRTYTDRRRS